MNQKTSRLSCWLSTATLLIAVALSSRAGAAIHVEGQWWAPDGTTGPMTVDLSRYVDEFSGTIDAPGNPDLDGATVVGSGGQNVFSLELRRNGSPVGPLWPTAIETV